METITTNKIDENTIQVVKTTTEETKQTYSLDYLLAQKEAIQKSKDDFDTLRDKEIADIDALIAECDKLDIKIKEVEQIIEVKTEN